MSHSKREIWHSASQDAKNGTNISADTGRLFQEATQCLCGTLDIEESFRSFFACLQDFMPVTGISMGYIRYELHEGNTLVVCDAEGVRLSSRTTNLTQKQVEEARQALGDVEDIKNANGIFALTLEHPTAHFLWEQSSNNLLPPLFFLRVRSDHDFWVGVTFTCPAENPFTPEHLDLLRSLRPPMRMALSNCLRYRELEALKEHFACENLRLRRQMGRAPDAEIVGSKGGLANVVREAQLVGATDIPVLIQGETGSGKELIAHAVHSFSRRAGAPFIAVNCGAIPASLIDSELFGHARGAFTGAVQEHKGYFEQAHGGTLFLDEIGELPLDVQARLLRVLQDGTVKRVGGTASLSVDFRLIAATHRDLRAMAAEGNFREDLYYRLRVVQLSVPPLRERKGDIPLLATHFLQVAARRLGIEAPLLAPGEMARLSDYAWPGNVRELRNTIAEALVLSPQGPLHFRLGEISPEATLSASNPVSILSGPIAGPTIGTATGADPSLSMSFAVPSAIPSVDKVLAAYFRALLDACQGQINGPGGAAEIAGLNGNTLRFRLRKLGIAYGKKS